MIGAALSKITPLRAPAIGPLAAGAPSELPCERAGYHPAVLITPSSLVRTALVAGLLLVPGCGDDGDSDEAATSSTSVVVTATTTSTPPAPSTTTPTSSVRTTAKCRTVGFTPNSEDAASSIEATGLSCDEAEAFVRVAGTRTSSGGPEEVDVQGFHCERTRTEQDPLPQAFYECTSGTKKVTFVRS